MVLVVGFYAVEGYLWFVVDWLVVDVDDVGFELMGDGQFFVGVVCEHVGCEFVW